MNDADPTEEKGEAEGRWVTYFGASDWIGPVDAPEEDDIHGFAVSAEIDKRLSLYLNPLDIEAVELDPEADGVGLVCDRRRPIVTLVRGLRRDGLLFGDPSDDPEEIVVFVSDDEAQVEELPAIDPESLPLPIKGPYEWPEGGLRGYFSTGFRHEWSGRDPETLLPILARALAAHGLASKLVLHVDGPDDFALEGTAIADFEEAARALGLDGIDQSLPRTRLLKSGTRPGTRPRVLAVKAAVGSARVRRGAERSGVVAATPLRRGPG